MSQRFEARGPYVRTDKDQPTTVIAVIIDLDMPAPASGADWLDRNQNPQIVADFVELVDRGPNHRYRVQATRQEAYEWLDGHSRKFGIGIYDEDGRAGIAVDEVDPLQEAEAQLDEEDSIDQYFPTGTYSVTRDPQTGNLVHEYKPREVSIVYPASPGRAIEKMLATMAR